MYYVPKYFTRKEFFSPDVYELEKNRGDQIWRLMDSRILITADRVREHFCGSKIRGAYDSMYINTWGFGGRFKYRGLRHIGLDIILAKNDFSMTSQHAFGRAMDYHLRRTATEEIIEDIKKNPMAKRYEFIIGLELNVAWVHNDTRCWNKDSSGLFTFKRTA